MQLRLFVVYIVTVSLLHTTRAAERDTSRGDAMLREYFRHQTQEIADACLADIETLEDWTSRKDEYRRQLLEMLGLDPLPEKTPLNPVVTGAVEHAEFTVEKLHFQSRPGLYVTGNLYLPKEGAGPFPTILYVCGHARVVEDGVSFGNKTGYQHHGAWFARNGYVCLAIDTLQLGEIEGVHHGTYGRNVDGQWQHMWWWNARGYTPAGVEAWNCVRALDYLQTRPEVDAERIGVTGRSGGGAYSWWIAAIDDRIRCAVPVAGITDLQNHVVAGMPGRLADGCVDGHCDCMYIVNTYRWDYAQVAALVAPRPLLISNSDKDGIFPLDGVVRVHDKVREIYRLYGKEENLGLQITEGPHRDTQVLRIHAFSWFNRHLKGDEPLIEMAATKLFEPSELKVFDELPGDQVNTHIHDAFVPQAEPKLPATEAEFNAMRDAWMTALKEKAFRGWPDSTEPLNVEKVVAAATEDLELSGYEFTSEGPVRLRLYLLRSADNVAARRVRLRIMGHAEDQSFRVALAGLLGDAAGGTEAGTAGDASITPDAASFVDANSVTCFFAPRGIGDSAWSGDDRKQVHIRRRFMLLGQTLDGMRVWDVIRAAQAVRQIDATDGLGLHLVAEGETAELGLYASLFVPELDKLSIGPVIDGPHEGIDLLNVRRFLVGPQVLAMAAGQTPTLVQWEVSRDRDELRELTRRLGWPDDQLQFTIARE